MNIPYPMHVNGTTLPAGDYDIRQNDSQGGGRRILHFFTDRGMQLETTAMAIPALDNDTPTETKLVLERFGSDYYLNKIWVQGKDYGYEFPIPEEVRSRQREASAPVSVSATYAQAEPRVETAQATPPPAPAAPARTEPAPAPATEPAQAAPAPARAPEPVRAAPASEPAPAPVAASESARREAADRTMPETAGTWLNMLLGGGLLAASGFALRRAGA